MDNTGGCRDVKVGWWGRGSVRVITLLALTLTLLLTFPPVHCQGHCAEDSNCQEPFHLDEQCQCMPPDGATTTTTTTNNNPGSCHNIWNDGQCDTWAELGECEANPSWMKENCRKSCNVCDNTINSLRTGKPDLLAQCFNQLGDQECQSRADRGECETQPGWMKKRCRKACGECSDAGSGARSCTDEHPQCRVWAENGFCANNQYTQLYCRRSCNTCDDSENTTEEEPRESTTSEGTTLVMSLPLGILATLAVTWKLFIDAWTIFIDVC